MSEPIEVQKEVIDTTERTPALESKEALQLEAQKAQLEAEIAGLEGTKRSLLDDVVRTRQEKRDMDDYQPPQVDIEAIKKEIEDSILGKVSGDMNVLREELVKSKDSEIKAKKAVVDSINARMASASGSSGPSASDPLTQNNEVELSDDEKKIIAELGITDPRYLKETELRR